MTAIPMHAWAFRGMLRSEALRAVLWQNWREGYQTAWRYYYWGDDI